MRVSSVILAVMGALQVGSSTNNHEKSIAEANPIRKVVTLMQDMQKEIVAEGDKEKELFDKFMCFCGGSSGDLQRSVADSRTKIDELSARLKSSVAEKTQVKVDIVQNKKDLAGAINDKAQATQLREKEHAEYNAMAADAKTNIAGMAGATVALENGAGGASLMQLPHVDRLHKLIETYPNLDSLARRDVISFLDQSGDYVPQSGQIVGILKQMKDQMESDFQQASSEEAQAAASFGELKASKEQEAKLLAQATEAKTERSGNLAVAAQQAKDQLEDEQEELADAERFLANLRDNCATKEKEWNARVKLRNEEVSAISEAIAILTEEGSLSVFKKTLPGAPSGGSLGFLQKSGSGLRATQLEEIRSKLAAIVHHNGMSRFRLMLYTLNSKIKLSQDPAAPPADAGNQTSSAPANKGDALQLVAKIVKGMLATLRTQQQDDDKQKDWCNGEFMKAHDQEKGAKSKVADLDATVDELADSVAQLAEQIKPLKEEIVALDRSVAEATEQRKEEHAEYIQNIMLNNMAQNLVKKARNRLHKFYSPTLYRQPATPMSEEERVLTAGISFLQKDTMRIVQPQAPETFSGGVKKNEGSVGIISMMDTIVRDLEMSGREAEMDENDTQKDYAKLMGDSHLSRSQYAKSVADKEAAKAALETKLLSTQQSHRDANKDLSIVEAFINDLHISCDFLLENYDARKQARVTEMDSLMSSGATLEGAQKDHAKSKFNLP